MKRVKIHPAFILLTGYIILIVMWICLEYNSGNLIINY